MFSLPNIKKKIPKKTFAKLWLIDKYAPIKQIIIKKRPQNSPWLLLRKLNCGHNGTNRPY